MVWEDLKQKFNQLKEKTQKKIMAQFFRIVDVESQSLSKDQNGNFTPYLQKGQVVKVYFVGLGAVIDSPHYAVVWDAHPKNEHIVVLPLTSKTRAGKGYFEIGPIDGLPAVSHVVKANQPQSVSRKSVKIWTKKDNNGNNVVITLNETQLNKTEELFRISQLGEPTLVKVLTKNIGLLVPITESAVYYDDLHKPVHYFLMGNQLYYKIKADADPKLIELV
ncbi:hypothetical protein FVE24_12275, partial [Parageobacillus sp. SY1]